MICRKSMAVFYNKNRVVRDVKAHGNCVYISSRQKYMILYVNSDVYEEKKTTVKKIKGVTKVIDCNNESELFQIKL